METETDQANTMLKNSNGSKSRFILDFLSNYMLVFSWPFHKESYKGLAHLPTRISIYLALIDTKLKHCTLLRPFNTLLRNTQWDR